MKTIWKVTLPVVANRYTVQFPLFAEIISVHYQNGMISDWAYVNPNAQLTNYYLQVLQTGQAVEENPERFRFIGTAVI